MTLIPGRVVEATARICYELNRVYCEEIGDSSQQPWETCPEWQRASAMQGVIFHVMTPHAGPEASHENWVKDKLADGWLWGPVKDPVRKEHPCMVPFHDLPLEQQAKDALFRSTVHLVYPVLEARWVPGQE